MGYEVTSTPEDLPEHLELPLRSGSEYWYWIGGSIAVDLVNTLLERWRRRVECLAGPDDLAGWLTRAGLVDATAVATARQVADARALRECIDALLVAAVDRRTPDPAAIGALDAALGHWAPRPALVAGDGAAPMLTTRGPEDPVDAALGRLALDAASIVGGRQNSRLRICAATDCSARFLDRSPAGGRRWCSMAGCGNRAKVRRHRSRA